MEMARWYLTHIHIKAWANGRVGWHRCSLGVGGPTAALKALQIYLPDVLQAKHKESQS